MILNPGTQFFDFTGIHGVIVSIALAPVPADLVASLNLNPAADTSA